MKKKLATQITFPIRIVNDAQGPMGIVDASNRAVVWFSDAYVPANGYVWVPERRVAVADKDGHNGTTYYSKRNKFVRDVLKFINARYKSE